MNVVIIPCYKVKNQIIDVIKSIGNEIDKIIVIDDKCPEETGEYVKSQIKDKRIKVLIHKKNLGVGGACKTGYKYALSINASKIVKIDGDGQMDSSLIPILLKELDNDNDYVKGNRFYSLNDLKNMPSIRLFGNSILSLVNKFVNGYWNIMDPTNGFTAINSTALKLLPLEKIENRYFFESDMLFRLSLVRAKVKDITMTANYGDEKSNLKIRNVLFSFPVKYITRFFKRIFYCYFLRDFNVASLELLTGIVLLLFGTILGVFFWHSGIVHEEPTTSGRVMLAALPIILGFQLLLSALNYDIQNIPKHSISKIYRQENSYS